MGDFSPESLPAATESPVDSVDRSRDRNWPRPRTELIAWSLSAILLVVSFWFGRPDHPPRPPISRWLTEHRCWAHGLPDGGARVVIPDEIDPDAAVRELRSVANLREIHFYAGAATFDQPTSELMAYEWSYTDVRTRIAKFEEAFPGIKITMAPNAF
ncbi:MAG: hypothetical protein KF861_13105 [Planctomycetaceae bacterium]|nr:hypothetical protein [Planctomycetaceae bacterium]